MKDLTIEDLIEMLKQGNSHLKKMEEALDFPWEPENEDPRKLHNCYIRSLIGCYISKFSELSELILDSIANQNYLAYALSGRSLIEITATLRYYIITQYKTLFSKGSFNAEDFKKLIDINDKHLRGGRFDWNSFLQRQFYKLKDEAIKQLQCKKKNQKYIADNILQDQVNVLTCIEKWAYEVPEVLFVYNLFCDLVHPNIGSNFLVASLDSNKLYFTKKKGELVGKIIFEQSFLMLLSTTQKTFNENFIYLMSTIWQDENGQT